MLLEVLTTFCTLLSMHNDTQIHLLKDLFSPIISPFSLYIGTTITFVRSSPFISANKAIQNRIKNEKNGGIYVPINYIISLKIIDGRNVLLEGMFTCNDFDVLMVLIDIVDCPNPITVSILSRYPNWISNHTTVVIQKIRKTLPPNRSTILFHYLCCCDCHSWQDFRLISFLMNSFIQTTFAANLNYFS